MKFVAALTVALVTGIVSAQTTGTGSISGTLVTDEAKPVPIRRARVTLNSTGPPIGRTTITDDAGRFSFGALPAGGYLLAAKKAAFVTTNYGAKKAGRTGTPIPLADKQQLTGIIFRMMRGAAISGTILDHNGDPYAGRPVLIRESRLVDGERTLVPATASGDSQTDDRGHYRFFGLAPGDYFISVAPRSEPTARAMRPTTPSAVARATALGRGTPAASAPNARPTRTVTIAPIHYPGTSNLASAAPVHVSAGEDRIGIDLRIDLLPAATVEVLVSRSDGQPVGPVSVSLAPVGPVRSGSRAGRLTTGDRYVIAGVPPGDYLITAEAMSFPARLTTPNDSVRQTMFASTTVSVSGTDISGISLTVQPEPMVRGRVVFEGTAPRPDDLTKVSVDLQYVKNGNVRSRTHPAADGTFTTNAFRPDKYSISAFPGSPPLTDQWLLKSVTIAGRDVTDRAIEAQIGADLDDVVITFGDKPSELSGSLQVPNPQRASDFFIILFPADRAYWMPQARRIRQTRPSIDGTFVFKGLPAGEYMIGALTDVEDREWFDPAFLEALIPASVRIALQEGEKKQQVLGIR